MHDMILTAPDGKTKLFARKGTGDEWVLGEVWARNTYQLCKEWFDKTGIFVDLGGNIGIASLFALSVGAKHTVAYEAAIDTFEVLVDNTYRRGYPVACYNRAVWGDRREVSLIKHKGNSHVAGIQVADCGPEVPGVQFVQTVTLEDVFTDNDIVEADVMKMDIEHAEYSIFGTAPAEVVARARRIVMEFHAAPNAPENPQQYADLLAAISRTHVVERVEGNAELGGLIWAVRR
jgi:FkbM family methyltransferase